ncbi:hypothetical protein GPX89_11355 [Nocardia sp. ET3-3]|uniref:Integral membrane protein n=1 Tax=Nocardia terrae TaxID=2675851 RepID=A0A7K1UUK6_9NOCA|nr:hypothetical protein [Nocardia terrae]MVU77839.1 hypothetical protein [Nocardia terrae]
MTGTPPSAPYGPSGDRPGAGGGEQYPPHTGQHQNPEPAPYSGASESGPPPSRHQLPGLAGYPQFEGPGAAQYGSEPVEPPPPLTPQSGAPLPPPGYGGNLPPQQQPPGSMPPGNPPPPSGFPPGQMPPPSGPPPGQPGPTQQYVPPRERLDVGATLTYGWDRFRLNPIPWVGMVLIGLIAWLVVVLLVRLVDVQSLSAVILLFAVVSLVVWLLQAAMIRGALYETDGTPPDFPAFFGFVNAGNVLITALIVFAACFVAAMACVFPAVIVGVLCMFALHFVIDQDQNPVAAIVSSARLVIANALHVTLLALAVLIITTIGVLFCGLGLLIAGPVTAIATTYAYRTLTGRLVVPV